MVSPLRWLFASAISVVAQRCFMWLWDSIGGKPGVIRRTSVREIGDTFYASESAVSKWLAILERAGLIEIERYDSKMADADLLRRGDIRIRVFHPSREKPDCENRSQIDVPESPPISTAKTSAIQKPQPTIRKRPEIAESPPPDKPPKVPEDTRLEDTLTGKPLPGASPAIPETLPAASTAKSPPNLSPGELVVAQRLEKIRQSQLKASGRYQTATQSEKTFAQCVPEAEPSLYTNSTIVDSCLNTNCSIGADVGKRAVVLPSKPGGGRAAKKQSLVNSIREKVITKETDPKSEYLCIMVADMILDGKFDHATTSWEVIKTFALEKARNRGGSVQGLLNLEFGEQEVEKYRIRAVDEWKAKNPCQPRKRTAGVR